MGENNFGNRISALRKSKGFTQAYIAGKLGVTPAAVSKWENGSSKPRVEVLFKLAQLLDVSTEELMNETVSGETASNEKGKPKQKVPLLKIAVVLLFLFVLVGAGYILTDYLDMVKVPNVVGVSVTEATRIFKDLGIEVVKVNVYDEEVDKGVITSQSIKKGKRVEKQTSITVTVSKGRQPFAVPNVEGKTLEEARNAFVGRDFEIKIKEKFSDTVETGRIISQSLEAGSMFDKRTEIILTVSKGIDAVIVPSLEGKTEEEAKTLLKEAGLNLKSDIKCSNTVKEGRIISQEIKAGTVLNRGSWVTAVISAGKGYDGKNANGNNTNLNTVVKQGDWVYYTDVNYNQNLCKMRPDGSEKQTLATGNVRVFCVRDEWIYYSLTDHFGVTNGIYKMKLDKSERTKLRNGSCSYIQVEGDWIYFDDGVLMAEGVLLHRMKTDGTEHSVVCKDKIVDAMVIEGKVYVVLYKDEKLYRMDLDGSNRKVVNSDLRAYETVYSEGSIYSIHNNGDIQRVSLDGSNYEVLEYSSQQMEVSVVDGYMYLYKSMYNSKTLENKYAFTKSPTESSFVQTELLTLEYSGTTYNFYMIVVDGWLYFPNYNDNARMYRVKTDGSKTLEPV